MLAAPPLVVPSPSIPLVRRPAHVPHEPGTDYPRLEGVHSLADVLARLAERLPSATAKAFPPREENEKLGS